jgi:opacity protein-like surface antigen
MPPLKLAATTGLLLLAATIPAFAADMPVEPFDPPPPPLIEEPAPKLRFGDGWYLRGDIGYVMNDVDLEADLKVPYWDRRAGPVGPDGFVTLEHFWNADPVQLTEKSVEDSGMFGGGIGYDFGWARVDGTVDYALASEISAIRRATILGTRGAQFSTRNRYVCEGDANCSAKEIGEVSRLTFLANAYVDLGEYWGITPYAGAGIGAARMAWSWSTEETCYESLGGCKPGHRLENEGGKDTLTLDHGDTTNWSFAWALMAGASYRLDDNLLLDLGYRYLVVEDGDAVAHVKGTRDGPLNNPSVNKKPQDLGKIEYKDFVSQEVRVGLRYTFGSF